MNGWEKLDKSLLNDPIFYNQNVWRVYTTLLLLIDKDGEWRGGRRKLAKICGLTESTVRRAITLLKKRRKIDVKVTQKWPAFSICYFEKSDAVLTQNWLQNSHYMKTKTNTKEKEINKEKENELIALHEKICALFGKDSRRYLLSDLRQTKLKTRLKEFSPEQITTACENITKSPWHMGQNDRKWTADPYWVLNSYERTEQWLSRQEKPTKNPLDRYQTVRSRNTDDKKQDYRSGNVEIRKSNLYKKLAANSDGSMSSDFKILSDVFRAKQLAINNGTYDPKTF